MNGTLVYLIASAAAPATGCRITIMSTYPDTTLIVSANDSPLATDEEFGSEKPIISPPKRFIAASKLNLVLVDGS